jgi:hypothetical protein
MSTKACCRFKVLYDLTNPENLSGEQKNSETNTQAETDGDVFPS